MPVYVVDLASFDQWSEVTSTDCDNSDVAYIVICKMCAPVVDANSVASRSNMPENDKAFTP